MSYKEYFYTQIMLVLIINSVYSEFIDLNSKSSLTFVIDDTGSMSNEIRQVKEGAKSIFDTVMNSNSSQIEDFILVTFNDPSIKHRITTKNLAGFKNALDFINVYGGGDCPEMCMTGIKKALIESRPRSLLYIFTDASAKDYEKYEEIKDLAQRKLSQIIFVLTGMCGSEKDPHYKVFEYLATATSGQVFHLDKSGEVHKILKYVEELVKSRKTVIANKDFPPGPNTFTYEVDSKMKELVISVAGRDPSVTVTGPDGKTAATEDITRTSTIAVVKVTEVKPGVYNAEVNSQTRTSVVVTGRTTLHFVYGFAPIVPSTISSTATKPLPDTKSFVAIKLTTDESDDVVLETLQIRNMDDNIVTEVPFNVTADKKNQFYVTDKLKFPNTAFRIAIKGYDSETKTSITRISLTPTEPQIIVDRVNIPPTVAIVGESKVTVEYDNPLELRCSITAYPKPVVVWEDNDGNSLPADLTIIGIPNDYLSVLAIDSVKENKTYTCKAENDNGQDKKDIVVETTRAFYLDVLEAPKSEEIEIDTSAKFVCKVDARPTADIKWLKNGQYLRTDENIKLSPDSSELIINRMKIEHSGRYMCVVTNLREKRAFKFYVGVSGVEQPKIEKNINEIRTLEGANVDIECRLLQGKPKPTMRWFFQTPQGSEEIDASGEDHITLNSVTTETSGTYRCEAHNDVGDDYHYTDVIVDYPPVIRKGKPEIKPWEGDKIRIPCRVVGEPAPEVKWFINDTEIDEERFKVHKSHSLNFRVKLTDSGTYRCQATNPHGTANATTLVQVIIPPQIESPAESRLNVLIGKNVKLPCVVNGFPKPKITWIFYSSNSSILPRKLKTRDPSGSLSLQTVQLDKEGYYACEAKNIGGNKTITYEVKVLAPPQIQNIYPEKTLKAVVGDKVLRVRCQATGNPKPDIIWIQEESGTIPAGSEWYDIDNDGTLIIKNVGKDSGGEYICQAQNSLGVDREKIHIDIEPYPRPDIPKSKTLIEEGHSSDIECNIPHTKIDSLNWFKDGRLIAKGELRLENVQTTDSGIYTCRVSTFEKARNANVQVTVGSKPRFLNPADKHIEFLDGFTAVMDCNVEGNPEPQVSWWNGGGQIPFKGMTYTIDMKVSNMGQYTCLVKNSYGSILRQYEISSKDCMLNIKYDFDAKQPLMVLQLSDSLIWPSSFERVGEYVRIPNGQPVRLSCPNGFQHFPTNDIMVRCLKQKQFLYNGKSHEFQKFQCRTEHRPILRKTGESCLPGNTEKLRIGYEALGQFLEVYSVCFDVDNFVPIYAEHNIDRNVAAEKLKREEWYANEYTFFDLETIYNCNKQMAILKILGTGSFWDNRCCFSKRQLINSRDVLPGLSQRATYNLLNVVPQWSSCNSKNWDSIEELVRNLAKFTPGFLKIWTGRSQQLQISGKAVSLVDQNGEQQSVPQFLWKVVQDPATRESVAIIQVNVPYLTESDAMRYVRCRDVCNEIEWMDGRSWRDVRNGFIYCCNIKEFEANFGYHGIFNSGDGKLLYRNAPALPSFTL
ncbi:hemicentin-1-like [Hyposmocoma kahamanoa]|uniref:hemicentin-1-like n=1 Tax=Hyposmocoma kahamanoa TaxID=1477025 RepID=UPI000E6D6E42|nr:hemicentin-1-like [Hyposmocoma kahamanoa]